jgi:tripartite-type tricarboxylate transporter receptor subunit TctC
VKADAQWKTIEEFIAYAKANPGKVTVANSGVGSFNHLTSALIEQAAGVEFKHVPMDAKTSTTALIGGKVDAMVNMVFDTVQQEQAGTIKPLAVVADTRQDALPDVPTFKERGIETDLTMYRGIAVPKDTPDDVVKTLADAFAKAGEDQEFKDFAKKYGVTVKVLGAEEFDTYMKEQDDMVAKAMDLIGMKKQ